MVAKLDLILRVMLDNFGFSALSILAAKSIEIRYLSNIYLVLLGSLNS